MSRATGAAPEESLQQLPEKSPKFVKFQVRRWRSWIPLALAAAFGAWEICFASFMADDFFQLAILEGVLPTAPWGGVFDLYTLADGDPAHVLAMKDAGLIPWFFDPTFKMGFFRPLSSGLLALDHALFGLHPSGYRLHGVLWALLLVGAVTMIFRRVLPQRVAAIAALVFVLSGIHGMFCWTAARHAVVAAALGFVALAAHLRWRENGWQPGAFLSLLALALGLTASEAGVAVAAYLFCYEAFGALDTRRARLRAALPAFAIVMVYLVVWQLRGHGASPGSGYVDPLRDPWTFLAELPLRLAVLIGSVVIGGHADLWVLRPDLRTVQALVGAAATFGLVLLLRAVWQDVPSAQQRTLRWLGVAAVMSAIPFAGTPIGSRCLLVPLVGGAALIAAVIERWWTVWRFQSGVNLRPLGIGCVILVLVHVVLPPLGRLVAPVLLKSALTDRAAAVMREAELDPATIATQRAVVLVAPDLIVGLHGGAYPILYRQPRPAAWHVLSWARARHRFVRTSSDTLEMEVGGNGIESRNMRAGTVVAMRELEATVQAVGGRGPTRVRFRFAGSLDDPSLTLLAWRDGRLRRVPPPPVGGTITFPQ